MLLYIHIPFCDSKCSYCSFNSYVDKFDLIEQYMHMLLVQLKQELVHFNAKPNSIESVFIGGGTPSTVPAKLYKELLKTIQPYLAKNAEITSEANPNSASEKWLDGMINLGVNRISFGVQSFDAKKLKILNRSHTPQTAIAAVKNARKIGFENISIDIIYGVAGDSKKLLLNDLNIAYDLPLNHISAYALTIEEDTLFASQPQMSQEKLAITTTLFDSLQKHGFAQYEISNFGSYQSTHNLGYWRNKDYIGLGAGAVGKKGLKRFYPQKSIEKYLENPLNIEIENLSQENNTFEQIFLGLRSIVGVSEKLLNKKEKDKADILRDEKKLHFTNGTYYNKNFLLADEIALFISS